jgi:hypothetical protein
VSRREGADDFQQQAVFIPSPNCFWGRAGWGSKGGSEFL